MKSYASVDRIEGNYCVCEVELIDVENSSSTDFFEKETEMMDVLLEYVLENVKEVKEGDILIVEHINDNVIYVFGKDEQEKNRRIEILKQLQA